VIPGNDDALRAIRLFASKISDSVVEGAQAVTDKQLADIQAGVQYSEGAEAAAATEGDSETVATESTEADDVSMEEVLGKGARRTAAAEEAIETPSA
jgi:small subunit ribosomal protein S2